MKIITTLPHNISLSKSLGLTIGNFDGVHLGHQYLLQCLRQKVGPQGKMAVLTFSNHPMAVLKRDFNNVVLSSLDEKLALLERQGVDFVILLEFTHTIAQLSYDEFLIQIRTSYPFTDFVLGAGSSFGKGRAGTQEKIIQLGNQLGFTTEYLEKMTINDMPVSSGRIRTLLQAGSHEQASKLLGRTNALP